MIKNTPSSTPARPVAPRQDPPCLHSHDLFSAGNEIRIEHHGETYRLRLTRNGKLILTK